MRTKFFFFRILLGLVYFPFHNNRKRFKFRILIYLYFYDTKYNTDKGRSIVLEASTHPLLGHLTCALIDQCSWAT